MSYASVGKKIRELRTLQGLTQMQLAERINLSYQQLQKYESGRSQITLRRLSQISEALEVPVNVILKGEVDTKISESSGRYNTGNQIILKVSRDEAALIKLFRRITNKKIKEGMLRQLRGIAELEEGK